MKISIALAQIHIQLGQPQANLAHAEEMLQAASGCSLFLLPELWTTGYDLVHAGLLAGQTHSIRTRLEELSRQRQTWIGGSMLTPEDSLVYNTFSLFSPDQPPASYQKLHLFRLMQEHNFLAAGNHTQTVDLPWCQAGLAICYDLRFPELFRHYALAGVACFLLVSEWPLTRIDHWKTLLRARAIENQAFFIAVNNVGSTGDETFGGCSAIISPWGETIAEAGTEHEELLKAEIDLEEVSKIRRRIPIFLDRRPDVYGNSSASPKN